MKYEAGDDVFLSSRSNFQQIMSKSLGDFTSNVKIKKRKREMVSDSDSDVSRKSKKNKMKKLDGGDVQFSIKQERISDMEDDYFIGKSKKHKKSKIRANEEEICERDVGESIKRKSNGKMSNESSLLLIKTSLADVQDDNTFREETKRKKSKKCIEEQFNCTTGQMFEEPVKKKSKKQDTDEEDVQNNESIGEAKKREKSKKRTDYDEITINKDFDDVEQKMKTTSKKNKKQVNDLLARSSNSVNGFDEEVKAYLKRINCTGAFSNSNNEEPTKNNHKEFYREHSSSRKQPIKPPSAEYVRGINKILNTFENENESLQKVCCEDSYISSLNSSSPVFIVQIPTTLNPNDLIGKEISFLREKPIKTGDGKYITTSSDDVEPVMLTTNNQCMRLHPTHIVTFEKYSNFDDSDTFNVANFANNLDVNVIDPAGLTKKNPIIGLEKEECERVLNSSVENKLKAAEKMYRKYKNKKIKKLLSTEGGTKQENIKDEEIFKYLSQPSQLI